MRRHASALILFGGAWLLQVPPLVEKGGRFVPQLTTPAPLWDQAGIFDTGEECENARRELVASAEQTRSRAGSGNLQVNFDG